MLYTIIMWPNSQCLILRLVNWGGGQHWARQCMTRKHSEVEEGVGWGTTYFVGDWYSGLSCQQVDQGDVWHVDLGSGAAWSECSVAKVWEYQFHTVTSSEENPFESRSLSTYLFTLFLWTVMCTASSVLLCGCQKHTVYIGQIYGTNYTLIRYTVSL